MEPFAEARNEEKNKCGMELRNLSGSCKSCGNIRQGWEIQVRV